MTRSRPRHDQLSVLQYCFDQGVVNASGIDLPDAKFESLSAMDDPANMPTLQDVGARAAKQQVRGEDFPSNFDLVG